MPPSRVARLAALTLLALPALSCQEYLPTWAKPDITMRARVYTEDTVYAQPPEGGPPSISVDVTNTTSDAGLDQFVIQVPYRVRVSIVVYLERDPSRLYPMSDVFRFTDPFYDLGPGKTIRCTLGDFPMRDRDGYAWNWGRFNQAEHVVVVQGTAKLTDLDVDISIPPTRVTVLFPVSP